MTIEEINQLLDRFGPSFENIFIEERGNMKKEVESLEKAGQILYNAGAFKNLSDPTEPIRRELVDEVNSHAAERAALESEWGQVWDTKQLQEDFDVEGFMAPFVVVTRKSDGKKGSMMFQHYPRYYFRFEEA